MKSVHLSLRIYTHIYIHTYIYNFMIFWMMTFNLLSTPEWRDTVDSNPSEFLRFTICHFLYVDYEILEGRVYVLLVFA